MVVGGPGGGTIDVVGLDVPGGAGLVDEGVVVALVAGAGAGTLVEGHGHVLLLDEVHGVVGAIGEGEGGGRAPAAARMADLVGGGHCRVEGCEIAHHLLVLLLLVGVDGLGVLAEVIETGELLAAVAGKGAFAGVFSVGRRGKKDQGGGGRQAEEKRLT